MRAERLDLSTPRMQAAIEELQRLIQQHYPEATFQVEPGDDPTAMYVLATVDGEDTDEVVEVYIDRLLELQIDEGLGGVRRAGAPLGPCGHLVRHEGGGITGRVLPSRCGVGGFGGTSRPGESLLGVGPHRWSFQTRGLCHQ